MLHGVSKCVEKGKVRPIIYDTKQKSEFREEPLLRGSVTCKLNL
jgi:hypothetical protein